MIAVATAMFAEEGFDAVSTKKIALASGLTIGALYHHFESKDALYQAVVGHAFAKLPPAPEALFVDSAPAEDQLRDLTAWFVRIIAGGGAEAALLRRELLEPRLTGSLGEIDVLARLLARFRALMARIAPHEDGAFAEAAIIALSFGLTSLGGMQRVVGEDAIPADPDAIAERVTALVFHGLGLEERK